MLGCRRSKKINKRLTESQKIVAVISERMKSTPVNEKLLYSSVEEEWYDVFEDTF